MTEPHIPTEHIDLRSIIARLETELARAWRERDSFARELDGTAVDDLADLLGLDRNRHTANSLARRACEQIESLRAQLAERPADDSRCTTCRDRGVVENHPSMRGERGYCSRCRRQRFGSVYNGMWQDGELICAAATVENAEYIAAASPDRVLSLLDRLQAAEQRAEEAVRERDRLVARCAELSQGWDAHSVKAIDAEQRAEKAERERDDLHSQVLSFMPDYENGSPFDRVDRAESRLAKAVEALREIASYDPCVVEPGARGELAGIARGALADVDAGTVGR